MFRLFIMDYGSVAAFDNFQHKSGSSFIQSCGDFLGQQFEYSVVIAANLCAHAVGFNCQGRVFLELINKFFDRGDIFLGEGIVTYVD